LTSSHKEHLSIFGETPEKNFSQGVKAFSEFVVYCPDFKVFCCQNGGETFLVVALTLSTSESDSRPEEYQDNREMRP
jgi:hypothetical protein